MRKIREIRPEDRCESPTPQGSFAHAAQGRRTRAAGVAACLAAFAAAAGLLAPLDASPRARAVARMIGLDGKEMGKAVFQQVARGVVIELEVRGLAPGAHAVMIHTSASCDPRTQFTSAGPDLDFDPPRPHGYLVTGGPRPGDLPNQFAGNDGVLHVSMYTTYFTLGGGKKSLFDRDGASIIVRAKGDDYLTAPDGGAGARIACGTIVRTVGPKSRARPKAKK
jgi:superoxide dismutase, Cu-Zn family